jgi:hypothetical protein
MVDSLMSLWSGGSRCRAAHRTHVLVSALPEPVVSALEHSSTSRAATIDWALKLARPTSSTTSIPGTAGRPQTATVQGERHIDAVSADDDSSESFASSGSVKMTLTFA